MEIQQTQQMTVQDALKVLSDYRIASGFQTAKYNPADPMEPDEALENTDIQTSTALPRVGRYINITA